MQSAWQREGFLGGTCLVKFAKALREFLTLICSIVVYMEIWGLIRKPLHYSHSLGVKSVYEGS